MFIYLSKILPLLVYPLGLACVTLIGLMVADLWTRNWGWRSFVYLFLFLVIYLGGNIHVSHWLTHSLEKQHPVRAETPSAEMIVVLGGATRTPNPPRILPEINERGDRLIYAAYLFHEGAADRILVTGGLIAWLSGGDVTDSEAESMQILLEMLGVPAEQVILEPKALNTYENAVYTKEILDEMGIERVILVTSAAHMPRSVAIFEKMGIDVIPAPTDFIVTDTSQPEGQETTDWGTTIFYALPQAEYMRLTTDALKEYFGIVVYRVRGWA